MTKAKAINMSDFEERVNPIWEDAASVLRMRTSTGEKGPITTRITIGSDIMKRMGLVVGDTAKVLLGEQKRKIAIIKSDNRGCYLIGYDGSSSNAASKKRLTNGHISINNLHPCLTAQSMGITRAFKFTITENKELVIYCEKVLK